MFGGMFHNLQFYIKWFFFYRWAGIALGLVYGPNFMLLSKYFHKQYTMASAIGNTGVSAGTLAMPLVLRYLIDEYSFPNGLLIVGGK